MMVRRLKLDKQKPAEVLLMLTNSSVDITENKTLNGASGAAYMISSFVLFGIMEVALAAPPP